ncbi:hypothetical protein K2W90_00765 [Candidatus Babeliales bacterium]|nr:hypothetical protein [Candidatus Babeliales bacterium]
MKFLHKHLAVLLLGLIVTTGTTRATSIPGISTDTKKIDLKKVSTTAGTKPKLTMRRGDFEATVGGKILIEHYFAKDIEMANHALPDQAEYFKQLLDLNFDFVYGKEKFDHKALEAFFGLRQKGVWGLGSVFADSDTTQPTNLKLSSTEFGSHRHSNGKPLIWMNEGWLQFSLNSVFGKKGSDYLNTVKLGWFPFSLGRGIALGSAYGANRDLLGLYSYPEDKSAPGILLSGELIKEALFYDIYYAKFEERDKSLGYTLNTVKEQLVTHKLHPWRGVGKDDQVIASRLVWKPLREKNHNMRIEPYVFYNDASDQKNEVNADTKMQLGTLGLNIEHVYRGFEISGEIAGNYGRETLHHLDRNRISIRRNATGQLEEYFTHILTAGQPTVVTAASIDAAKKIVASDTDVLPGGFTSKDGRIRPPFVNELHGWMGVIDLAYTTNDDVLKLAAAYAYASGDNNPHTKETNKNFKEFVGLHEWYTGKNVPSVIVLGQRLLKVPSTLRSGDTSATEDFAFTDLHQFGLGFTVKPKCCQHKGLSINPNVMFFWKAHPSKVFEITRDINGNVTGGAATDKDSRKFMGTEFNIVSEIEIIKDLKLFAILAMFAPGGFFTDVSGVPLSKDFFDSFQKAVDADGIEPEDFRLSDDRSFFVNVGFEYKF